MVDPNDEEQTRFTLKLISVDRSKVSAVKAIIAITGATREAAIAMVERAPVAVLTDVPRDEAERGKALLDKAQTWSVIE